MRVMVPGCTVTVNHFARHLEVGHACADLLLSEREKVETIPSHGFPVFLFYSKLYFRKLVGEE